ncbi:MAG TPA: hypothetical protein VH478_25255 [Trebonia sp.]|jgi:hypothetical protein|nr:hypothetical protein [Trebonia sp.]
MLNPEVLSPRSLRWLTWSLRIAGPAYAAAGLVAIIAGTSNGERAEGIAGILDGLFMSLNGWVIVPRSQQRAQRNAAEALRLTEARSAPESAPGGRPGPVPPGSPATAA